MIGQPARCGSVGWSNRALNHSWTSGSKENVWRVGVSIMDVRSAFDMVAEHSQATSPSQLREGPRIVLKGCHFAVEIFEIAGVELEDGFAFQRDEQPVYHRMARHGRLPPFERVPIFEQSIAHRRKVDDAVGIVEVKRRSRARAGA